MIEFAGKVHDVRHEFFENLKVGPPDKLATRLIMGNQHEEKVTNALVLDK